MEDKISSPVYKYVQVIDLLNSNIKTSFKAKGWLKYLFYISTFLNILNVLNVLKVLSNING